jgi:effector-binding domain-containing protein
VRLENGPRGRPIAVVRRRVEAAELKRVVPQLCGVVWNALRAQQVTGAGRHVAVYLDCEINLEVGAELERPFSGDGEVVGSEIPAGMVATTAHMGPYGGLGAAHQAIRDWCARNGHALAGPNWEIYGHWEEAWNKEPSKIRTDVYYLLKGGAAAAAT